MANRSSFSILHPKTVSLLTLNCMFTLRGARQSLRKMMGTLVEKFGDRLTLFKGKQTRENVHTNLVPRVLCELVHT